MKLWSVPLLLALPFALMAGENPWFQGSLDQAQAQAKKDGKQVFLKFYKDT